MRNKNETAKVSLNHWFDQYSRNITSQSGEDGILERIFELMPDNNRWCCEFGAWDGKKYSNTYNLIANKGWFGVFIEADKDKYIDLSKTYMGNDNVVLINEYVSFSGDNVLDNILAKTVIPKNFDLLSIDIDGNDYHVWASVNRYSPKVVIIEYNQTIPNHIEYVQQADARIQQGNSILSIIKLAKSKGYELVAITELNAFFVQSQYYTLFNMVDNTLGALRPSPRYQTDIFQLYDGTIVLHGNDRMIWHDVQMKSERFQVIPEFFRTFPGSMRKWQLFLLRLWKFSSGKHRMD